MAFDSRMERWDAVAALSAARNLALVAMFDVFAFDRCYKDRSSVMFSGLVSMETLIAGDYIKDVHQFAPTSPDDIAKINSGINISSFVVIPHEQLAVILAREKGEAKSTISVKGVKGFGKMMVNVISTPGVTSRSC
jgi:hypothetical protein